MKLSDNPYCFICNKFISIEDDALFHYGRWNHRKCYDTKKIREFLKEWKKALEEELKEEILNETTGKLVPLYEYDEIWKDLGYKLEELEDEE